MNRQQRRVLEKQGRKSPAMLQETLGMAIKNHQEGQLELAETLYLNILKALPSQPDAHHFLGVLLHQSGRSEAGIRHILQAIAENPNYLDAYNNLGNIYKEIGEQKQAKAAYQQVIALNPNHSAALNNLGVVLKALGEYDEAVSLLMRATALEPQRADYFHNLGNAYQKQGDLKESAAANRQSIALQPYQSDAYRSLYRTLILAGELGEAAEVCRQWLRYDPNNAMARHHLTALTGEGVTPQRASDDYVRLTFDGFADSFDEVLERLDYRAPGLVAAAVGLVHPEPSRALNVLDAGCGTGLLGPLLRDYAASLTGIDLSPKMLDKAGQRQVYDRLETAELVAYLQQHPASFDLIASADTLVYFGELGGFFHAAQTALQPGGLLALTLEKHDGEPDYRLNLHGRYSHSLDYVQQSLSAAGLQTISITEAVLRQEARLPVAGFVITALLSAG